ncbi:MFS transporter [Candidatus Gracilibacteria bacterium]|nr:MFS transporter [Candidatus Gracilibacteria bacterium]NUJ99060.1 MFS transporter [Candidatus Gracilibacteria bacterium]
MLKKLFSLEANIWKHFIILFTGRRNFVPILSIYYLSLPNTHAQEIGFYTAVGYAFSLIFQIPAGVLGDKLGNKTTIIISKILLLLSSIMYVIGDNFWYFLIGSTLMSLGADAFSTGNTSAFLHDTLTNLKKEDTFKKVSSTIRGWVSFISIFFIIALPFFTSISLNFPFKIGVFIDIIGLITAFSLYPARGNAEYYEKISFLNVKNTIKESKGTGLFSIILFSSIISSFLMTDGSFRGPYLQSLGYPVIYIGFVMGLSRLVRFVVGKYASKIEDFISFKKLMILETFIFSLYYIFASFIDNPYFVGLIFSLIIGYQWGRSDIYTDHIIKLIPGKKYKSTILSIKGQIIGIIQIILMTIIAFVMNASYKLGFLVMGISLFVLLMLVYVFLLREKINK